MDYLYYPFLQVAEWESSWLQSIPNLNIYFHISCQHSINISSEPHQTSKVLFNIPLGGQETQQSCLEKLQKRWSSVCTDDGIPIWGRAYRVSLLMKDLIKEHLKDMHRDRLTELSNSPWSSPVVLTEKKDGGYQFCVDYRRLNAKTSFDAYPMHLLHDILESLSGAAVFSSLDLRSGYWQVVMEEGSRNEYMVLSHLQHHADVSS